jgi:hypothetical protein
VNLQYDHAAVKMTTPWGDEVMIDINISGWLQQLWDAGVRTSYCCEGWLPGHLPPGRMQTAYLVFDRGQRETVRALLPDGWMIRRWDIRDSRETIDVLRFTRTYDFAISGQRGVYTPAMV